MDDGLYIERTTDGRVLIIARGKGRTVTLRCTPQYAQQKAAELVVAAEPPPFQRASEQEFADA